MKNGSFLVPRGTLYRVFESKGCHFGAAARGHCNLYVRCATRAVLSRALRLHVIHFRRSVTVLRSGIVRDLAVVRAHLRVFRQRRHVPPDRRRRQVGGRHRRGIGRRANGRSRRPLSNELEARLVEFQQLYRHLLIRALVSRAKCLTVASREGPTSAVLHVAIFELGLRGQRPQIGRGMGFLRPGLGSADGSGVSRFISRRRCQWARGRL